MYRRAYTVLIGTAAAIFASAFVVAVRYDRPLVEPEGKLLGPSLSWALDLFDAMPTNIVLSSLVLLIDMFIRAFSILLAALLVDLVVRGAWGRLSDTVRRARADTEGEAEVAEEAARITVKQRVKERWTTHWTKERMTLVVLGTVCFYITYVCYRNLKSSLPFVRPDPEEPGKALLFDRELHILDRVLFFGNDPSDVLHAVFGTNISAFVLSQIYLTYLPLVILLVAVWLVWSRNVAYGYWFVTSQVIGWTLGTISYYLLPTLGPGIEYWPEYTGLTHTPTTDLMESITSGRNNVLYNPTVTDALNSVAGFASLHVAITLLWALMVQYTIKSKILHWVFWVNFALTVIATLYFGWHYVADDIGGIAIAILAFYLGGIASGQKFDKGLHSHPTTTTSKIPINAD